MSRLVPYLRAGDTDGVQIGPPKMCLCVRLAAAHCVAWCIGQSVFPVEALVCHVQPLFHSLVQLIYVSILLVRNCFCALFPTFISSHFFGFCLWLFKVMPSPFHVVFESQFSGLDHVSFK